MHSQSVGKSPQDHGCWFGWVFGFSFGFFWIVLVFFFWWLLLLLFLVGWLVFWFGLSFLSVSSFVLVEICSFRTGGRSANTVKGSSNTNAFTGSTSDGSLPVTARWLQPGPLGKNPH